MDARHVLGQNGQDIARDFLMNRGYLFVEANYRVPSGEIDLIFKDGDQYVFVEVKTRRSEEFGIPENAITGQKKQRMRAAALKYLVERDIETDNFRFDAIAIVIHADKPEIRHHIGISVPD